MPHEACSIGVALTLRTITAGRRPPSTARWAEPSNWCQPRDTSCCSTRALNFFRIIPIVGENERQPSASRKPSFQGSSVGHWEGDTLVVEVTNFNGKPWLGGAQPPSQPPQTSSDALRIVERWSRPDAQIFEYRSSLKTPKMLTAPWTGPSERRGIMPYDTVQESLCFLDSELDARHREFAASEAAKKAASAR